MSTDATATVYETAVKLELEKKQIDSIKARLCALPADGDKGRFPECTCLALFKRGKYNESACEAHKLTLRNSKPHPYMLWGVQPQSGTKVLSHSKSAPAITPNLPLSPILTSTTAQPPSKKTLSRSSKRATTPGDGLNNASTQSARRRRKSSQNQRRGNNKDESTDGPTNVLPSLPVSTVPVDTKRIGSADFADNALHPLHLLALHSHPLLLQTRDAMRMLNQYNKVIELHAESPKDMAIVYTRRSTLLTAFGQYGAAAHDAEEAIRLDPAASVGFFRLGFALFGMNRLVEASCAFQRGLAVDIHSRELRHALDITLTRVRQLRHRARTG